MVMRTSRIQVLSILRPHLPRCVELEHLYVHSLDNFTLCPKLKNLKRTATFGLLYPLHGIDPVIKVFPSDFAQRAVTGRLPSVSLPELFSPPNNLPGELEIHKSLIIVGTRRFMVYGYVQPDTEVNETISRIKPSSIWRGEVVIFSLGRYVPFLSRPSARRTVLNKVVARFVWP